MVKDADRLCLTERLFLVLHDRWSVGCTSIVVLNQSTQPSQLINKIDVRPLRPHLKIPTIEDGECTEKNWI